LRHPVDFLVPGMLALAVMSTAMVSLGIATGFERRYGVLKRLGATPLSRAGLLAAKTIDVLAIEVLQAAVIIATGAALGWDVGGARRGAGRVGSGRPRRGRAPLPMGRGIGTRYCAVMRRSSLARSRADSGP